MEKRLRLSLMLLYIFIVAFTLTNLFFYVKAEERNKIKEFKQEEKKILVASASDQSKETELTKDVIKNFIKDQNSNVSDAFAEKLSKKIVKESNERGNSPFVQAALLASESSFRTAPKHDIKTVYGMGGIYADVWRKNLKKEGIIWNDVDLLNPYTNIEASSYILSVYMNESKTPREALARYKGYCSLGKQQENHVMKIALNLRKEYNTQLRNC